MGKTWVNYWIDVGTGLAGLISAISGLVFLWPGEPTSGILGLSYRTWNSLHTWSSLIAILGVGIHLLLHRKWIIAMTRQGLAPRKRPGVSPGVSEPAWSEAAGPGLSRRAFLILGGAATLVAGAVLAGYKALSANGTGADAGSDRTATTDPKGGVACPFGLVNDPYPGRCPRYTDANGDGLCDYSVPGSGGGLAVSGEEETFSAEERVRRGAQRRRGWGD